MENQGFEEEHQQHHHQPPRAESSGKLSNLSAANFPAVGADGHVYEDISSEDPPGSMTRADPEPSQELPQQPSFSSCSINESSLQRNLSLPFRRGTALDPGTNYSVRVTTRERGPQWPREPGELLQDVRPSRRRRKKDCKHCRNKEQILREPVDQENVLNRNRENENDSVLGAIRQEPEDTARTRVFTVRENAPRSPLERDERNERSEDKGPIVEEKGPVGMRVNSIYSQERWYAKEAPIFFTDVKEDPAFQRAYSLPVRTQSPACQNRLNLRRSVRGEPPPHPARLDKHRHGWTLHLARPLEGPSCTRSLVLLLILLLALVGVGAVALYIVFEPEKLQIIQQYLRSSSSENATERSVEAAGILVPVGGNRTILLGVLSNQSSPLPDYPATTLPETEAAGLSNPNRTRHCDDCLPGEVCVALLDEEVPICRLGLDNQDPTGCAGFCLINKQRCHRLDVDAFRCVEVEHYCLEDEWTCLNTLCIPLEKHCDGHMNCYDHSDEYNCGCDLETHFQCGNETSCLPLEKRCDGKIDCWDAADEINCTLGRNLGLSCPLENEFTCSDGQCILKARFCDGLPDCADGSDEPHGCQGRCNKHEFTCQNSRCITKGMKCNGLDDCGDGSDERHCKERF